jgi:hypothetical protein
VKHQHHDADEPHVGEIAEQDQERAQAVMQGVFVEVSFSPDEDMTEETTEVFAKLQHVKNFHLRCGFVKDDEVLLHTDAISLATEPSWHVACLKEDKIGPN